MKARFSSQDISDCQRGCQVPAEHTSTWKEAAMVDPILIRVPATATSAAPKCPWQSQPSHLRTRNKTSVPVIAISGANLGGGGQEPGKT